MSNINATMSSGSQRLKRHEKTCYTMLILCPLSVEGEAMLEMFDERHDSHPVDRSGRSSGFYSLGRIGKHFVDMVSLPATGPTVTAVSATRAQETFPNLEFFFLVGVAAGIQRLPSYPVQLGDVVISDYIRQYDVGEYLPDGSFKLEDHPNKPPQELRSAASAITHHEKVKIIANTIKLKVKSSNGRFDPPNGFTVDEVSETQDLMHVESKIYRGKVASGNSLITNAAVRDAIHKETDAICIEMEAAGIADDFKYLTIRGICDMADAKRGKDWRRYASLAAAITTKALLESLEISVNTDVRQQEQKSRELARKVLLVWRSMTRDSSETRVLRHNPNRESQSRTSSAAPPKAASEIKGKQFTKVPVLPCLIMSKRKIKIGMCSTPLGVITKTCEDLWTEEFSAKIQPPNLTDLPRPTATTTSGTTTELVAILTRVLRELKQELRTIPVGDMPPSKLSRLRSNILGHDGVIDENAFAAYWDKLYQNYLQIVEIQKVINQARDGFDRFSSDQGLICVQTYLLIWLARSFWLWWVIDHNNTANGPLMDSISVDVGLSSAFSLERMLGDKGAVRVRKSYLGSTLAKDLWKCLRISALLLEGYCTHDSDYKYYQGELEALAQQHSDLSGTNDILLLIQSTQNGCCEGSALLEDPKELWNCPSHQEAFLDLASLLQNHWQETQRGLKVPFTIGKTKPQPLRIPRDKATSIYHQGLGAIPLHFPPPPHSTLSRTSSYVRADARYSEPEHENQVLDIQALSQIQSQFFPIELPDNQIRPSTERSNNQVHSRPYWTQLPENRIPLHPPSQAFLQLEILEDLRHQLKTTSLEVPCYPFSLWLPQKQRENLYAPKRTSTIDLAREYVALLSNIRDRLREAAIVYLSVRKPSPDATSSDIYTTYLRIDRARLCIVQRRSMLDAQSQPRGPLYQAFQERFGERWSPDDDWEKWQIFMAQTTREKSSWDKWFKEDDLYYDLRLNWDRLRRVWDECNPQHCNLNYSGATAAINCLPLEEASEHEQFYKVINGELKAFTRKRKRARRTAQIIEAGIKVLDAIDAFCQEI